MKELGKMLVKELQAELKKRGLDTKGKKIELTERLQEAIDAEATPAPALVEAPAQAAPDPTPKPAPAPKAKASTPVKEPVAAPKADQAKSPAKKQSKKAEKAKEATPMDTDTEAPTTEAAAPKAAPKGKPSKKASRKEPSAAKEGGDDGGKKKPKKDREGTRFHISLQEIEEDEITKVAGKNWSVPAGTKAPPFDAALVQKLYKEELAGDGTKPLRLQRVMLLEYSQYLERYLWPHFDAEEATFEHVMSIIILVNEKFREGVPAWACFQSGAADKFPALVGRVLALKEARELGIQEKIIYLLFMIHSFQSLENEMVRGQFLKLVSLPLWHSLSPGRLQLELRAHPQLDKHWRHMAKKEAKAKVPNPVKPADRPEARMVIGLLEEFLEILGSIPGEGDKVDPQRLLYTERFLELLIDLLSQLPTRRFVRAVLDDRALVVKCRMHALPQHPKGRLFGQLLDLFRFYQGFEIDDHTGAALNDDDMVASHSERITQLQRLCFRHVPKLRELALSHCAAVEKRPVLAKHLSALTAPELHFLATKQLRLVHEEDPLASSPEFLKEVVVSTFEKRRSQRQAMNALPLYPNEDVLWDENMVPSINYTGEGCLALPKLNLQFLTFADYLLRNFNLFRLEATYEIREDIGDVLNRTQPYPSEVHDGATRFGGWARMACPINSVKVVNVAAPRVGEVKPADVLCEVTYDLGPRARPDVRKEWDELKQHDVVFLLTIRAPERGAYATRDKSVSPKDRHGLVYVRGAEVVEVRDEKDDLMNDMTGRVKPDQWKPPKGSARKFLLALDTAQYQIDTDNMVERGGEDVYGTFNLMMRRRPKENNFKAILECIRDLMNESTVMPDWLHDIFLGYGDPGAAHYSNMPEGGQLQEVDFKDTFLDAAHLEASFPEYRVEYVDEDGNSFEGAERNPPFRVTFPTRAEVAAAEADAEAAPPAEGGKKAPKKASAYYEVIDGKKYDKELLAAVRTAVAGKNDGRVSKKDAEAVWAKAADGNKVTDVEYDSVKYALQHFKWTDAARAWFNDQLEEHGRARVEAGGAAGGGGRGGAVMRVEPYVPPDVGPYPENVPPRNKIRFTPVQVEAIKAGVQPGLSMVVGPPGTGKTDVAVQIMHVLYHNCPGQRTLLITHSNQALNDLFQKIMERDVPARYLLRLGQGEQELETDLDFSRAGRVNAMLARRLELLAEVERMAKGLGVAEDVAYTCETAAHFWLLHVLSRWEKFTADVAASSDPGVVQGRFPFKAYFADVVDAMFEGKSAAADMSRARGCFRHLRTMFTELEECRAFELLKNQGDRSNYLLTKHAKIVAMTCTHAALKRHDFLKLGFKYDNLLMEESAQILEIETFIPMLLQRQEDGHSRLKRAILIGDHHQLPPVVKNMAFQKYSHLDQSLFTRFVRLGTPYVELNAQGRARPEIAQLYNWRYRALGDLPYVSEAPAFLAANPGFLHPFQFVDVGDYGGRGESEPTPHFYQNLGEAEYIVSVFQYMRLLGYPAEKISILTTYNGQKHLLRDVINQRCAGHPMFGRPRKVTTVDKYQGQQNDYILLSLVRSKVVGHVRDVRRLVVAMSRSRLGLYVFGRRSLFENCYELAPTFAHLLAKPTKLQLLDGEEYAGAAGGARKVGAEAAVVEVDGLQHMGVVVGNKATKWMSEEWAKQQTEALKIQEETVAKETARAAERKAAAEAEAAAVAEAEEGGGGEDGKGGGDGAEAMDEE